MFDYHELHFFDTEKSKEDTLDDVIGSFLSCKKNSTKRKDPEHNFASTPFNWLPINLIKNNFQLSTQHDRTPDSSFLKKTYHSPFLAFNAKHRYEPVATDSVYSDTPAVDDGSTCAQLFVGTKKTLVTHVYGMKTDKQYVNNLEDNIRKRGAMDKFISDSSQSKTSNRVKDTLREILIDDWKSKTCYHDQNFAERLCRTVKSQTNNLLYRTGALPCAWLLAMIYVFLC